MSYVKRDESNAFPEGIQETRYVFDPEEEDNLTKPLSLGNTKTKKTENSLGDTLLVHF